MRVRLVRRPGQPGTHAYVEQYGDRLICVRYRYDEAARRRYKTVELIVDEQPWAPRSRGPSYAPEALVAIRIGPQEKAVRLRAKSAGATWRPELALWSLSYAQVAVLGLTERIVGTIEELTSER